MYSTDTIYDNTTATLPQLGNSSLHTMIMEMDNSIEAIVVPIFFGIIFLLGVAGNILVIVVMIKIYHPRPQGLNNTDKMIVNLAVSDLLFLFFCVPFHAAIYTMNSWPFGAFLCQFTAACENIYTISGVFTLVGLSFDRYFAVVHATSATQIRTPRNAALGQVVIWSLAFLIGSPGFLTRKQRNFEGFYVCVPNFELSSLYIGHMLVMFIFGYVFPLLVILACYVVVINTLCKNARKSSLARNKSDKSTRRVAKVVVAVVIVFAVDWFPHHLLALWKNYGQFPFNNASFVLTVVAHCLSYANSAFNPLVYAFVSNRFRNDFKNAFICCKKKTSNSGTKKNHAKFLARFRKSLRGAQTYRRSTPTIVPKRMNMIVEMDKDYQYAANTCMIILTPNMNERFALNTISSSPQEEAKNQFPCEEFQERLGEQHVEV